MPYIGKKREKEGTFFFLKKSIHYLTVFTYYFGKCKPVNNDKKHSICCQSSWKWGREAWAGRKDNKGA